MLRNFRRPLAALLLLPVLNGCAAEPAKVEAAADPRPTFELPKEPDYKPHPKGTLTFSKDIAPIVFNNCTSCHRTGEVAPFPLTNFREVQKRDVQIAGVVKERSMPPWKPVPGYGDFHDARRLTADQVGMLAQWVEEGSTEGDAKDLPELPKFTEGWQLGPPDLVLKMPKSYTAPAEGRDVYRCFVIPIPIDGDKYVKAVEYRPGNHKVVHHALLFLDSLGQARAKEAANKDGQPGFTSFGGPGFLPTGGLGGWAPGALPRPLPDGLARKISKGTDLVLQIHFHPTGKAEEEESTIGIYYAKEPPKRSMSAVTLRSREMNIAPGDNNYKVSDSFVLPVDVEAFMITPHAHLLGKDVRAWAVLPDGKTQPLLWINDWDFSWQGQYQYQKPIPLPKGTKVEMEFTYDNSDKNPRNPSSPPKRVRWGEQTTDEMSILWLQIMPVHESDALALKWAMGKRLLGGALGGNNK